ncbi:minor tail protein [Microbacterium phage FuzzBuster]|uniref:Minor tail protein n=1 Tax=Microbacterium phage FuzzBuster TaxID=2590935 RepID=A0A516KV21_9CAUD|nr:minor tail protein [Microbacterium phage FuzzBuster]
MAYEGWFRFGGNEIINNERARGYSQTAACPMFWLKGPKCDTLRNALGDSAYVFGNIPDAPWYDLSMPDVSGRFYGVFALSVVGLKDSTRSASVTEGIDDGAQIGRTRKGARQVRIRAILVARGADALEYGTAWLNASLDPNACGQHGTGCGTTDLEYLAACPPARDIGETDEEYAARVAPLRRFLHNVAVTSGPYERELHNVGDFWGQVFEWTITAGRPWVYSATREVDLPVTPTIVIQDTPYNLAPYPSAELAGAAMVASTNYSTNPSVETNATGWAAGSDGVNITAAMIASGRVTGELQAVGNSSFRTVFTASGAGANGSFYAQQEVSLAGRPAGSRVSINQWAAELLMSGTPVRPDIELIAYWRNGSGGTVLRTDNLGTIPVNGGALSVKSIVPPAGATHVLVRAQARVTSWPAGTVLRLYTDALAVTVP